jgi:hypothetical protein
VLSYEVHQHEIAISEITTAIEHLKSKSLTISHGLQSEIKSRRRRVGKEERAEDGEEESEEEDEITITIKDNRRK